MANSRSARKRIRSSERKHERNRAVKSAVRTKVIKARHALLDEGATGSDAELHAAIRAQASRPSPAVAAASRVARLYHEPPPGGLGGPGAAWATL